MHYDEGEYWEADSHNEKNRELDELNLESMLQWMILVTYPSGCYDALMSQPKFSH